MKRQTLRSGVFLLGPLVLAILVPFATAQNKINLEVDATRAGINIVHVKETVAVKAGPLDLFYPKWIPGEHSPTGTINDVVNLFITVDGKPLAWTRDAVEMFAFHLTIPRGATQLQVEFDDVSQPGTVATVNLARIKWNRLLLYPRALKSDMVRVTASLRLPVDWKYATALVATKDDASTNSVEFSEVDLTTFIDSPAIIGRYFAKVPLSSGDAPAEMDIAAENAEALQYSPEMLTGWKNLVTQANLAFGAHHYKSYKFLLTLSDNGGAEGLEHHESSEDGTAEKALSDKLESLDLADLLGHEYTHSWNGKHRRPASLTTPDFEKPMQGDLLWVYEGLTQYLGHVFPTRAGLWTPEMFRESIAETCASMENQSGRRWRPLVDTATAVQFTYPSPRAWMNERRRVDYYFEGSLIWLDADVLIRQKSGGKLSLDDFLQKFHGGQSGPPKVVTYDLNEIVRTLNQVLPFDWRTFFITRVYNVNKSAPVDGVTNGGWKVVYNNTPNLQGQVDDNRREMASMMYSLGIIVAESGEIRDVDPDGPAAKAGLAPGIIIKTVNGQTFSTQELQKIVAAARNGQAGIKLIVQNGSDLHICDIDYKGGERFPHLVRDESKPDILSAIATPRQ